MGGPFGHIQGSVGRDPTGTVGREPDRREWYLTFPTAVANCSSSGTVSPVKAFTNPGGGFDLRTSGREASSLALGRSVATH